MDAIGGLPSEVETADETPSNLWYHAKMVGKSEGWTHIVKEIRPFVPLLESAVGIGAGLLVSVDGLILTNRHVVDGSSSLDVTFFDSTKVHGLVVHRDSRHDLAAVRAAVRRTACFHIQRKLAANVEAGDEVLAIGHPRGLSFAATRGIVSEPRRALPDGVFVQTDVSINPGNSGGPLLSADGALIGINTWVRADSRGLGFAIPAGEASQYIHELMERIRTKQVRYPSDEAIMAAAVTLSPLAIVTAALQGCGLPFDGPTLTETRESHQFTVYTASGVSFSVFVSERHINMVRWVASNVTRNPFLDRPLMVQMLRWQYDMWGPRFSIADDELYLSCCRNSADVDITEVRGALQEMVEAVDRLVPMLRTRLGEPQ